MLNNVTAGVLLVTATLIASAFPLCQAEEISTDQICKAGIAAIMGRDPTSIQTKVRPDGIVALSYIRPDDGKRWAYRCKLEGSKVIWAAEEGRWRTHAADERITYKLEKGAVKITQDYGDGSKSEESFQAARLK